MATSRILLLAAALLATASAVPDDVYREALQFRPDGQNTRGTNFKVAFIPNSPVLFSQPNYKLLISTAEEGNVTFTVSLNDALPAAMRVGFPYTATISYGEVHSVDLHEDIALKLSGSTAALERNKVISVDTVGGKKVTVQGFNDDVRTTDGFIAISCDAIRQDSFNEYEYFTLAADQYPSPSDPPKNSFILVITCEDDTNVIVEPTQVITVTHLTDLRPNRLRAGPGSTYSYLTLTAQGSQSMLIGHTGDLSGTIIRGSKPLIVFTGHQCGEIPYNHTACDHMVEQIPHGMSYGQTFFLTPLGGRVSGDHFRVGTLRNGARVTVTCVTSASDTPIRLPLEGNGLINRGEYLKFMTPGNQDNRLDYKPSYCCLDSTEPVIVAQYSTGYTTDKNLLLKANFSAFEAGDPFMNLVPPVHQFMNNHSVKSVDGVHGPFPFRFISLAIAAPFFTNSLTDRNRIKINGTTAQPLDGYIPFYCSGGEICGYGAQVKVPKGTHTIYHEQAQVGLYAAYYAYQQQNSNSFPLGFELEPLAATGSAIPDCLSVREDAGSLVIPVERYGNLRIQSRMNVYTRPFNATATVDYTPIPSNSPLLLKYRGGNRQETLQFITIPIINDNIVESREIFEIHFDVIRNMYLRNNVIKVHICDDDGAYDSCICNEEAIRVYFDPVTYTVNEDVVNAVLTIRTNIAGGPPAGSVNFSTSDGTALAGSDYTTTTSLVSFDAGSFTTTVLVPITSDEVVEAEEVFYGSLTTVNGANVDITQPRADVHIVENPVRVYFDPSSYTVNENDGTVTLTIRTDTPGGPPSGSVRFSTADGTATALRDYISTSQLISFQPNSQVTTVTVPIVENFVAEPEEIFYGSLTTVGNANVDISVDRADVHILDNDVRVWFDPSSYTVNENAGTVTLIVRTNLIGGPPPGLEFYTEDHTAISPEDYDSVSGVPVVFSAGTIATTVTVNINEDNIVEDDQIFNGRLRYTGVGTVNIDNSADVTIIDNDVAVVGFNPSVYTVSEDATYVIIIVENQTPQLQTDIVVQVATLNGTAISGSDFEGHNNTLTLGPGSLRENILVFITDDNDFEGTEEFYATLTTNQDFVTISEPDASITINDDDVRVYFERVSYEVSEDDGSLQVCVLREGGDISSPLTIQVSTEDYVPRQAQAGSDYTEVSSLSVTFAADQNRACFPVTILDDSLSEGVENFTARITSVPSGVDIGNPGTTVISIMDDESLIIELDVSEYTVIENEGSVEVCLRTNIGNNAPVNAIVSTSHASTSDGDYDGSARVVVIPASTGPSRVCTDIPITDDSLVENTEVFLVSFNIPAGNNANYGIIRTAVVSIIDDDNVSIGFVPSVYTVNEDDGIVIVTVVNRNPSDLDRDVVVNIESVPGTATDGVDYLGGPVPVTFNPGSSREIVVFTIIPDNEFEGTENFSAILTSDDSAVHIFQPVANISIIDSDVRVFFERPGYVVSETDGRVNICVRREGDISDTLTITVATEEFRPVEAESGRDYVDLHSELQLLSFGRNEDRVCFDVTILDDNLSEGDENFRARIISVPSGVILGNPNTTNITIIDNERFMIEFEQPDYTIIENDNGSTLICVNTSTGNAEEIIVSFRSTHVTTSEGDYRQLQTVTIPVSDGPSRVCFDHPIIDDNIVEHNETFIIELIPPEGTGGRIITSRIVIVNDDQAEIGFNPILYTSREDANVLLIVENHTPEMERDVTVQFFTVDGTAVDGADYIGTHRADSYTVTFSPNEAFEFIVVPLVDDTVYEGVEQFNGSLTTTDSAVRIIAPNATVHINDDDTVRVYFENTTIVVDEDGGPAIVCVIREGEIAETLTIQLSTSDHLTQATADEDFLPLSNVNLEFRPTETRVCSPVSIIRDDIPEGGEDFRVLITSVPPRVVAGPDSVTVTIIDEPEVITAQVCGGVCDRLDRIEAMLEKICDKLDAQDVKIGTILSSLIVPPA